MEEHKLSLASEGAVKDGYFEADAADKLIAAVNAIRVGDEMTLADLEPLNAVAKQVFATFNERGSGLRKSIES